MNIGEKIRSTRTAKGLSQKEVALALQMDQSQYSKIENGKTDPYFSTIEKIADALGVGLAELLTSQAVLQDINLYDKSLVEKVQLMEQLEDVERKSVFAIVDGLTIKRRLKDSLQNALNLTQ